MAKQMLKLDSIEAVTEFNQWLRGMNETAMLLWRTSVENLAGARSRRWNTTLAFAAMQTLILVAATGLPIGTNEAIVLSGTGVVIGVVSILALQAHGREVKHALTQKTLLERKLGFMHGQLEGVDMAVHLPSRRDKADRLARAGRWPAWLPTEQMALVALGLQAAFLGVFFVILLSYL